MKYFAVFFISVLAVTLVISNAAPQGGSGTGSAAGSGSASGSTDMKAGFGFNAGANAGGSAGGSGSAGAGLRSRRDLANNAPIAHQLHLASCNGGGPPPGNATSG